jgi:hypothetical protein
MRQSVALLCLASFGSGCSLIYNPSNITKPDAAHDAPPDRAGPEDAPEMIVDANPAALVLTSVEPPMVTEGQGSGGSRNAVLVVRGDNIVPGAMISITPSNGSDTPMVTTMAGAEVVGIDHKFIAVPVTAAVNGSCDTGTIALTVTVTQPSSTKTIDWMLECLPQINQSTDLKLPTAAAHEYSEVLLTGGATVSATDTVGPLIVRATADIAVAGAIDVSAKAATPGPGGFKGGAAQVAGSGAGGGGPGGGVILAGGGGGAGYHDNGSAGTAGMGGPAQGDITMTGGYAANFASGGGGGDVAGGGGGGTIELTAGGSVMTAEITSKGAAGTGGLGYGGGGGAGGTIVVRGATVNAGALTVSGGAAGSNGGGAGSPGRARVDSPMITGAAGGYVGLSIDAATPSITNTAMPTITVHGTPGAHYDVFTLDQGNNINEEVDNKQLGGDTGQVMPTVHFGWNRVCVVPHSASSTPTIVESRSCIEIAFLP